MSKDKEQLDREIKCFNACLSPFGSADISTAVSTALEAEHDGDWAAEQVERWIEDTETQMKDIDPVAVVYEAILQEARHDIEEATGKDILNDTEEQVNVYGNFMCTSLDYSENAQDELKKIIKTISKEDYTPAIKWLVKNADIKMTE